MDVERTVKNELRLWVNEKYKDDQAKVNQAKDAALRAMAPHFLIIAFLPFHAAEIRQKIKHWGDTQGFMTQCIVSVSPYHESCRIMSLLNHCSVNRIRSLALSSTTSILTISA